MPKLFSPTPGSSSRVRFEPARPPLTAKSNQPTRSARRWLLRVERMMMVSGLGFGVSASS